jgi:ribosome-associated toxin RatA of RatAB toxin-antitoxin module
METLLLSDELKICRKDAFKIISSIENYPDFVPGYRDVKLLEKNDEYIKAEIVPSIPVKNILMEAHLRFPEKILFAQIQGPLDVFAGEWTLTSVNEAVTKIDFKLEYYVKNFFMRKLIYKFVKMSFQDIIVAFKIMAKKLNGGYNVSV